MIDPPAFEPPEELVVLRPALRSLSHIETSQLSSVESEAERDGWNAHLPRRHGRDITNEPPTSERSQNPILGDHVLSR